MTHFANRLPESPIVPVAILARLFDNTTNSYKHLFFDALLQALTENAFQNRHIPIRELAVGMVAKAWYPIRMFRLSLGHQDKTAEFIARMPNLGTERIPRTRLREAISKALGDHDRLVRYVPYRILAPFFATDLHGIDDHMKNQKIRSLADTEFETLRPLFRFSDSDTLEVHPSWIDYFSKNLAIVSGWAELNWVSFLEDRNPTAPRVSRKAGAPANRSSLSSQTLFWKQIILKLGSKARCIYSDRLLDIEQFHLDHVLPWTFVCHDALWNLIPVAREANQSKSDTLPDVSYLPAIGDLQFRALSMARESMSAQRLKSVTSTYISDLRIPAMDLFKRDCFLKAYIHSVEPQIDTAQSFGFAANWRWRTS